MTTSQVSPALQAALDKVASEGIETEREQLVLWLIRSRFDIGDADSYASILYDRELFPDTEVDAVLVTTRRDLVSPVYVVYGETAGVLEQRVSALADALREDDAPESTLSKKNSRLRALFDPASDRRVSGDITRLFQGVCRQDLTQARRTNISRSVQDVADIEIIDSRFITALADAEQNPNVMPEVSIEVDPKRVLDLGMQTDALVTPVSAEQIAKWPGIADRTLFDLNVRFGLGMNRVRRSLDKALQDKESADNFIAYHNGITAVCSDYHLTKDQLVVEGLSVVNGAQTVVAIHSNEESLAPGVRVLLKLVKAEPEHELATNIAIRSNTQNPVTSRSLRALDKVQERLEREIPASYGYIYTRRPGGEPPRERVINNDDVAQLLCSIYVRKPALAVKRQSLFEEPLYSEIFPSDINPARVMFAHLLRETVEENKSLAPNVYQKAWALTALTVVNMTSEAMRDDALALKTLLDPAELVSDPARVHDLVSPFVEAACQTLHDRANEHQSSEVLDDFKVAFKQTRTLSDLATRASKRYRAMQRESAE